ncbi:MAG TPA: hypothetical protein VNU97_04910 [Rhizomicrobium sp.]|nr:hypothetical protein [Rhizomicrobium sp.]
MKKIATLAALLGIGLASVAPAMADAPVCLQNRLIDRTTVVNPKTILFRMKDGKVWRSSLATPCLSLKFNGFIYVAHTDDICGGSQSIRVLNTNEVCLLGRFTPEIVGHS